MHVTACTLQSILAGADRLRPEVYLLSIAMFPTAIAAAEATETARTLLSAVLEEERAALERQVAAVVRQQHLVDGSIEAVQR